jgi:ionotropic glutamate receptor
LNVSEVLQYLPQIIGEEFSRKPYAMAVQQGSPLKDIVNDG